MSGINSTSLFSSGTTLAAESPSSENVSPSSNRAVEDPGPSNKASVPETQPIAYDGDFTVSTGQGQPEQRFKVARSCMRHASPVWDRMLDPDSPFTESREKLATFPEDDSDALLILVAITHLRFDLLPETATLSDIESLVMTADKYGLVNIARPWLTKWLQDCADAEKPSTWTRMKIAWYMGEKAVFTDLLPTSITYISKVESGMWVDAENHCIDVAEYKTLLGAPADSYRKRAFIALFRPFHDRIHELTTSRCCQTRRFFDECDSIILGSLIRSLHKVRLWPLPQPDGVRDSMDDVKNRLLTVPDHLYTPKNAFHGDCTKSDELKQRVRDVWDSIPSPIAPLSEAYQKEHLERRAPRRLDESPDSMNAQPADDEDYDSPDHSL
ncbi:MAG: hypothetical protein M1828_005688 [Chrysothrix sp. TS-e1954]|nr:MAG: hypothetical protein M1828_005688 [Chrysothrix sp. TS-e1954]